MSQELLGQSLGIIAFFVGITLFFHRNEKHFKTQLAVFSTIMSIHFFLLGATPAGASALLNTTRTIISIRTRNVAIMTIFIIATLLIGIFTIEHYMEVLAVIGTILATWALFRAQGLKMRYILWCATLCWVVHNIWTQSIGGSLIEGSFLIINAITIIRYRKMIRQGIDPFAVNATPNK